MMAAMEGMDDLFANPLPSVFPRDLLIGIAGGAALRLMVYLKAKNAKKFRQGVEYGSARWGTALNLMLIRCLRIISFSQKRNG
jgi:type IV secretion system protein VirD4